MVGEPLRGPAAKSRPPLVLGLLIGLGVLPLAGWLVSMKPDDDPAPPAAKPIPEGGAPAPSQEDRAEPPPYVDAFAEQYPDPQITETAVAKIPGLKTWSVWDRSQEAEDPITVTWWIVTEADHKFPLTIEGVTRALAEIGFSPASEEQAVEAATLPFTYHGEFIAFEEEPLAKVRLPAEIVAKLRPLSVVREGDDYHVSFHTFFEDSSARWFGTDSRYVESYELVVGPGSYRVDRRTEVWSTLTSER